MMVYVEYKPNTGQIGSFYITNEKYCNRGLGGQILETVIDDIRKHGAIRVWLVSNKYPHPFWEKNGFIYKALFTHPIFSPFHRKMNLPAYFAEYFGTFLFILSILASGGNSLVIGATLAFIIFMIAGLGAGHVNPAVSLAFYLAGTLTPVDLFSYIGAQFFGGISAYYAYRYVTK
jgi:glycerol uptake facilitator-like aquaporin